MVSLGDSHEETSSITATSFRRLGHSKRTFRPKHHLHQPSSPPSSAQLSDSLLDFHLHHLASARRSPPSSTSPLLDHLSVSDPPSFASDISAELRLLSLPSPPPSPSPSPPSPPPSPPRDHLPLPSLRPSILLDIATLSSASSPPDALRSAASRLRLLAKHRSDLRSLIASSGAIPALVPLLRSPDPVSQENAVTAILNLSLEEPHAAAIAAAGAAKPLVYALRTGTAAAKQNAACALMRLSMAGGEGAASIGACGAIPPLVALLERGTSRGKKDALTTLYKLLTARQNKERAVRAGAVGPLVGMVVERGRGTAEKAVVVLGCLAGVAEGRLAVEEEGGLAVLVDCLEDWSPRGRELAVHTLLQMCCPQGAEDEVEEEEDRGRYRAMLVREGVIPPLVALSQTGSARAKQKAERLLEYLREHRQDGGSAGS